MSDINQKLNHLAKNISILYVEDDKETREQFENIFRLLFKETKSAKNGQEALEIYNKKQYDIIITDLTMPIMNGIDLISEILKVDSNQHIIIMTAHNTSDNLRNSIEFQVDGILLKPVSMIKLVQLLYKVCHQIDNEKKESKYLIYENNLETLLHKSHQAYFLVVIDKFNDILKEFGNETKIYIFNTVKEHLSYFGIEENSTLELHNDVIICATDRYYIDNILEALQDFSDSHNTLIVEFEDLKIYITLSYGLVIIKDDINLVSNNDKLFHHINSIVDEIKNDNHSSYVVKMDIDIEEAKKTNSLSWLGVTLDALKQDTIIPFYQAIADINTLQTTSYEIYSRIKQGDKYILPKFFIDLSQKAGILEDISRSVFKQSFQQLSSNELPFHLNISSSELNNSVIIDYLVYLSSQYGVNHSRVILGIINYESLKPSSRIFKSLLRLKDLGFKVALKGFAMGSINIELISLLQPDYIKVNQILIQRSLTDKKIEDMLKFLLNYTKSINIKSILAGVETQNILDEGKKFGFDCVQGYLISRPSSEIFIKRV